MMVFDCKAIIFDLDGVLLDSSAVVERHWQEWAIRHSLDMAVLRPILHGRRAVELMQMVAPHLDIQTEAADFAAMEAADNKGLLPIDGAGALLQSLPPDRWGIATSGTRAIALARLEAGNMPIPHVLVTADDVHRGKPAPDAYLMAASRLGIKPQDCLVFEDAPAGVQAAVSAGMRVVGLATSHDQSQLSTADVVIDSLSAVSIKHNEAFPGLLTISLPVVS